MRIYLGVYVEIRLPNIIVGPAWKKKVKLQSNYQKSNASQ